MPEAACRLAPLPSLGAISVTGKDAADFLAAQLSQVPPRTGAAQAPLAGWHDAKGRLQALFRVICRDDGYLLVTHESVVEDVTTSLRRYVLRAKVAIDMPTDFACVALVGDSAQWLAEQHIGLDTGIGSAAIEDDVAWLRLGPMLVHAMTTIDGIDRIAHKLPSGSAAEAELAEIRLGIPTLSAELRGQFLPQMLNLDVLGGVAFDKGCYPGQEIIARTQNLGTVKRRMLRFTSDADTAPPVASTLLVGSGGSAGVVVRAAPAPKGIELLAVTRLDALTQALTCSEPAGSTARLEDLPYALPGLAP
jgi:folate-binding protein YgfZ